MGKRKGTKEQDDLVLRLVDFLKGLKLDLQVALGPTNSLTKKYFGVGLIAAKLAGVSPRTVRNIKTRKIEEADKENKPDVPKQSNVKFICDDFMQDAIRRIVLNFYARKEYPTLEKIHKEFLENQNFPRVGKETFRKWLVYKCKFKHKKLHKKPIYLERNDIIKQREFYLLQIDHFRKEGYLIVYTDETWACPDHSPKYMWTFNLDNDERRKFFDIQGIGKVLCDIHGNTGGFVVRGGAGRAIVNHAGSELGFVEGAEDIFASKKDSQDYHSAMNGEHFTHWFTKLVGLVPNKSVIVMDQAPYHKLRVEETMMPKRGWRKAKIIESMTRRKVPLPEGIPNYNCLTIPTLLALSDEHPVKEKFLVEQIVEDSGKDIKILWLPVAHCELNPIELVWSLVKGYVAKHNSIGGVKNVVELCKEACREVSPETWKRICDYVIKVENDFKVRDRLIDTNVYNLNIEPIIIPVREEDSSDDQSDLSDLEDSD